MPEEKVVYPGMDISFNSRFHEPNWVAWELTDKETEGNVGRKTNFTAMRRLQAVPIIMITTTRAMTAGTWPRPAT